MRWARDQDFDWVIDLQGLARSALFAWVVNGKFCIGVDEMREGAAGFYDASVRRPTANSHAVEMYLEVLRALDVPIHWDFDWLPARP